MISISGQDWLTDPKTLAVMAALEAVRPGGARFVGGCVRNAIMDRGGREMCYEPRRLVDGKMVGGQEVPCEKIKNDLGRPASRDPGGQAHGLGETDPAGPNIPAGPVEERPEGDPPASDTLPDNSELPE